jgi:hypothetical protein
LTYPTSAIQLPMFKSDVQMIDDFIEQVSHHSATTGQTHENKFKVESFSELREEARVMLDTCPWSVEAWHSTFRPWTEKAASLIQLHCLATATHTPSPAAAEPCQHSSFLPRDIDRTNRLSSLARKNIGNDDQMPSSSTALSTEMCRQLLRYAATSLCRLCASK